MHCCLKRLVRKCFQMPDPCFCPPSFLSFSLVDSERFASSIFIYKVVPFVHEIKTNFQKYKELNLLTPNSTC